jgi:hypothetical protein
MIVMCLIQDIMSGNSAARSRALKDLERYVPDFHLPEPDPDANKLAIEVVQSDNFGGKFEISKEERPIARDAVLRYRAEKAAREQKREEEPDRHCQRNRG